MGCWKSVTVGGSRGVSLIKVITVNDQQNKGMNTFENTEQTLTEHSLGQSAASTTVSKSEETKREICLTMSMKNSHLFGPSCTQRCRFICI